MNFFQSVFSDDPEPDPQSPRNPNPNIQSITSAWQFSSTLLQTLASKSESVLQTYRHDLHEFTSGLKNETDVILEAGVESLESVGQAIDNLGNTVTSILTANYIHNNVNNNNNVVLIDDNSNDNTSGHFSRVDALIRNATRDAKTYLTDPEDLGEFNEWATGFNVDAFKGEIEEVMNADGGVVREVFNEVVPGRVDEVTFWERYFYKVWKIRKAEEARVMLVKKAMAGEEDEELSWDVDEYEEKEVGVSEVKNEDTDVKVGSEGKTDRDRDSDISIVSTQPSREEDGWDEIEDIGSSDDNKDKGVSRGSPDRAELRKRLSVAEEDEEDLTWDIEDDEDEPVKA
ncbi:BSD domain-containing protein 1-like protein [Tanacetum coccineum]|uniref:BSD domain-containing protein 1-like protein n=1 Tax=Tanacetum coccineum TaxID=301880 RepID=A0ABQ5FRD3_9ASTR